MSLLLITIGVRIFVIKKTDLKTCIKKKFNHLLLKVPNKKIYTQFTLDFAKTIQKAPILLLKYSKAHELYWQSSVRRPCVDSIYTDSIRVSINIDLLIRKLFANGINGALLLWFKSF